MGDVDIAAPERIHIYRKELRGIPIQLPKARRLQGPSSHRGLGNNPTKQPLLLLDRSSCQDEEGSSSPYESWGRIQPCHESSARRQRYAPEPVGGRHLSSPVPKLGVRGVIGGSEDDDMGYGMGLCPDTDLGILGDVDFGREVAPGFENVVGKQGIPTFQFNEYL